MPNVDVVNNNADKGSRYLCQEVFKTPFQDISGSALQNPDIIGVSPEESCDETEILWNLTCFAFAYVTWSELQFQKFR